METNFADIPDLKRGVCTQVCAVLQLDGFPYSVGISSLTPGLETGGSALSSKNLDALLLLRFSKYRYFPRECNARSVGHTTHVAFFVLKARGTLP